MLDTLTVELHEEFLDLPSALRRLLVERDADHAVRRGHGLGCQAGVLTLYVEVTDLTEVEQLLVEVGPVSHAAAVNVVGQMVDELQASADRMTLDALQEHEIDVINRAALTETVDQIQRRSADTLDCRQAQLHRTGG